MATYNVLNIGICNPGLHSYIHTNLHRSHRRREITLVLEEAMDRGGEEQATKQEEVASLGKQSGRRPPLAGR